MRRTGRKNLVIGGIAADGCVLQSVLGALREGYTAHVVVDAVASPSTADCRFRRSLSVSFEIRDDKEQEPMLTIHATPGDSPLEHFVEGVVRPRTLIGPDDSRELRVVFATFEPGARNLWHMHSFDQGLLITEGLGIIATEEEEREVRRGDFVLITAGERHWHGASRDASMTHLAVGIPGSSDFDGVAYTATE